MAPFPPLPAPHLSALPPLTALRAFEATARRLRNLEGALGVKLFHRLNGRLVLTDAGAVYHLVTPPDRASLPKFRALVAWLLSEATAPTAPPVVAIPNPAVP